MSLKKHKLIVVFSAISLYCLFPILSTDINSPTINFRNVFFYADVYTAREIIINGHIPTGGSGELVAGRDVLSYWGKIYNRQQLPIFPLLISEYSMIAGNKLGSFYSGFPGFLLMVFIYFLIIRHFVDDYRFALIGGMIGGIAPNIPTAQAVSVSSFRLSILLLCIYTFLKITNNLGPREKKIRTYSVGILPLFQLWLFYWYPPNFAIITVIAAVVAVYILAYHRRWPHHFLPVLGVGMFLSLQVFEIPLGSYINFLGQAVAGIVRLEFTISLNSQTTAFETAMQGFGYSWLPTLAILPFALLGGIYVFRMCGLELWSDNTQSQSYTFLILWGVSIVIWSMMYLSTGDGSFLITRPLNHAFPVMIVAATIALEKMNRLKDSHWVNLLIGVVCLLVLLSFIGGFYLQTTTPQRDIHSYQSGYDAVSEWSVYHMNGVIMTDMKSGAMLIANGYPHVIHPQTYDQFYTFIYSKNMSEFKQVIRSYRSDYIILSSQTKSVGSYGIGTVHSPTSDQAFDRRISSYGNIYSNGRIHILENGTSIS
jgi:hypothetical protein